MSANNKQIAGNHYKQFKGSEPWDVISAWNLGYLDGTAVKYIARWRHKNGIEDLRKAIHFLEKLIEVELACPSTGCVEQCVDIPYPPKQKPLDDVVKRLCDASHAASTQWCSNLNTEAILRPDNV